MYFTSPTSNISPALVSTAMSRLDSRDSTTSVSSFTSPPMQVKYSTSPATYRSNTSATTSPSARGSFSSGWLPSPYRSCMIHSSSSQGYESSSSYITDDDLLALDALAMPPVEHIPSVSPAPQQQTKREMTTEEHIALLREVQEREQAQLQQQQRQRAQQQRAVRFATEQRKPRRPSTLSRRSTTRRS